MFLIKANNLLRDANNTVTVTCQLITHLLGANYRNGTHFSAEKCYIRNAILFGLKLKSKKLWPSNTKALWVKVVLLKLR